MIQRIQTVWLFIAALVNSGLLFFDQYRADIVTDGQTIRHSLKVTDHYPSLLIALVITILPLVIIFMYKQRSRQRTLAALCIVFNIGFVANTLMRVGNYMNQPVAPTNGSYWIGSVLPVISMIFLFLAIRGIGKDEKLVKSLDRLR